MIKRQAWLAVAAAVLVMLVALGLRLRAVQRLPIDYDEDDYLAAAQRYTLALRAGDIGAIVDYDYNQEHPPLAKLLYGVALLPLPDAPLVPETDSTLPPVRTLPQPHLNVARLLAALLGVLQTLALALFDPLAGLLLAVHTWQIKYTSQVMLEPLPSLVSTLTALCYVRGVALRTQRITNEVAFPAGRIVSWPGCNRWLLLAALLFGVTVASKYTYAVVGLAIVLDWLWRTWPAAQLSHGAPIQRWRRWLAPVVFWGLLAVVIFFVFDPHLWRDPLARLHETIFYHAGYAQSAHVKRAGLPAWQPFVWLLFSPRIYHPGVFVIVADIFITLLAVLGLRSLWQRRRVFALWLILALILLLFWPTKWPQYILILTVPLCLAAAEGLRVRLWQPAQAVWRTWRAHPQRRVIPTAPNDLRRALPLLLPGALALFLLVGFPLLFQGAMSLTDFNASSIRDGVQGGVWRAVWRGLTGQERAVAIEFLKGARSTQVHWAGFGLFWQLLIGAGAETMVFTLIWSLLSTALQAALGVGVALLLHQRWVKGRSGWRALFILPWALPEFVGALVWLRVLEPRNGWLALAQNLPADIQITRWGDDPLATLGMLLIAAVWLGFPFIMLAAAAALKLIPAEVYDAVAVDGADRWQTLRLITWPLLRPLVLPAILIRGIFAFNQFYLFYALRTPWPYMTGAAVSFQYFAPTGPFGGQFAISAAINMFTLLVLLALIRWFDRWSKVAEEEVG